MKEVGAIEVTVRAMDRFITNLNICERGAQTIRNVSTNGIKWIKFKFKKMILFLARNKEIAGRAGAIESIVDIIRRHIANVDICESSLAALWSVTFGDCK